MLSTEQSFFFFQAEDGIRDHCVTGVQTCALPISTGSRFRFSICLRRIPTATPSSSSGVPMSSALAISRSEEHTSELQSHSDLVCRLLLEKKKKQTYK